MIDVARIGAAAAGAAGASVATAHAATRVAKPLRMMVRRFMASSGCPAPTVGARTADNLRQIARETDNHPEEGFTPPGSG
ncbi:hypothetical protein Axi01nite_22820 [Actinoplanes xinjiangensis]|nr:hypothetical protein Axi01nite_22820 [Actinoplanes xinjiangensis]